MTDDRPTKPAVKKRSISTQRLIKENKKKIKELGYNASDLSLEDYIDNLGDVLVEELTS